MEWIGSWNGLGHGMDWNMSDQDMGWVGVWDDQVWAWGH